MPQVFPAKEYRPGQLGRAGKADHMLLRAFSFPQLYYADTDGYSYSTNSKIYKANPQLFQELCRSYMGSTEQIRIERWLRNSTDERVLEFLQMVMGLVEEVHEVVWTGYRITGIAKPNGWPTYTIELFAKDPRGERLLITANPWGNDSGIH